VEEKKERQACLAEREERVETFLVVQERLASGWWWHWQWRRNERRGKWGLAEKKKKNLGKSSFFTSFGLWFLLLQDMESTLIYRGWKSDILSHLGTNLSPWFSWKESQPLTQSDLHKLSNLVVEGCLSWPLWVSATAVLVSFSQKKPYRGMVKCQAIIFGVKIKH